uniref:CAP domain-containing protein n=1 Tax=Strongyloides ratti TaxID=34506 RepID=A0A8L9MIG2_STRRB
MHYSSIFFLFLILLLSVYSSYTQQITITSQTTNGKTVYFYNGKTFNSMEEVMAQIKKDYPNVSFTPLKPGGNGRKPTGNGRKPTGNGRKPTGNGKRPTGNNDNNSGYDISKWKGTNQFSNAIFDRIWKGYNYDNDKNNGFRDMKKRFMQEQNEYRKAHGASPLKNDPILERKAQNYANVIASYGQLVHDPKNRVEKMGENLALGSSRIGHLGVKWWYDEIKDYDFNRPGFNMKTGHFTQLVWKSSTNAGFGVVERNGVVYVVCKYTPPGNYNNEYQKNVLERKS